MVKINKYTEIDLKEIKLQDTTFCFSFPQEADNLTESISKTGLIQPPILHENRIVCGRRRILSCKKLGWKMISVGIIEEKQAEIEIFKLNLEDNLSTRELNIIEKSIILNKFLNLWRLSQEEIIKIYLPRLNIPPNIKYLKKYIWLEDLSNETKKMIIKNNISLDTLNITIDWPKNILYLVLGFGFGNNKTSEILILLRDISLKNNSPVEAPIHSEEWLRVKNNSQFSLYQKGIWLRDFLSGKRYPMHTEFKNKVKELIDRLKLPENVTIELKNLLTWEDDTISLRLKCKKKKDLEETLKELSRLKDSPELNELLDILTIQ